MFRVPRRVRCLLKYLHRCGLLFRRRHVSRVKPDAKIIFAPRKRCATGIASRTAASTCSCSAGSTRLQRGSAQKLLKCRPVSASARSMASSGFPATGGTRPRIGLPHEQHGYAPENPNIQPEIAIRCRRRVSSSTSHECSLFDRLWRPWLAGTCYRRNDPTILAQRPSIVGL